CRPAHRERGVEIGPRFSGRGVRVIPSSPRARGLRTGTRTCDGERRTGRAGNDPIADALYSDEDFDVVDRLVTVAGERGLPPAQVALAWLLHKPGVTAPIVGATKLSPLQDAIAAVEVPLT